VDECRNPFPAGDIGQLEPAEPRVQQHQPDSELAVGNHRVDDHAMIPAEHAEHLSRVDSRCQPAAGQGVRAPGGDVRGACNRCQPPHRQPGGRSENRAAQIEQPCGAQYLDRAQSSSGRLHKQPPEGK
jgi:hypothetical protein